MLSGTSFFMPNLRSSRLWSAQGLSLVLVIAAAFVLAHPYTGIRHDGTLYAGDALARLLPGGFRDDLYFLFGSQGRFTLLPALYAALISAFGIGDGTIVGLLIAFALHLAVTWYLVAWFAPARWQAFCVLSVTLGWTLYGGNRIFGYSESFLTARSFAEPAVLLALAWLVRGRLWLALAALLVALTIHPLIAAGGCLVAWVYLSSRDRRWLLLAPVGFVVLLVLGVIGAIGGGLFADLFSRYDAQWLALVHEANGHAFVLRWTMLDYGVIVFNAAVLWFVARLAPERADLRRLAIAAAIAGVGATVASLVLVDLIGNPFIGKLQIWRAEWVMQWMAMATLPIVLRDLWRRGEHGRVSAAFMAIGWVAPFSVAPALLAVMAVVIDAARARFVITHLTTRVVCAVAVIVALAVSVQYEARVFKLGALLDQPLHAVVAQALTMNLVILAGALLLLRAVPKLGWAGPIAGLIVLAGALSFWDQRSAWTQKLESYPTGAHIWPGLIEPKAKVYWYRDLIAPWVLLGHGNYYTQQQGSGAVFSRDMVVELDHRRKVTAILDFQEQICRMMNNLSEKQGSCEPDAEAVRTVCTEGGIDYVVLQSSLEGARQIADFSTGVVENGYEKKFFLYRCSALKPG